MEVALAVAGGDASCPESPQCRFTWNATEMERDQGDYPHR